ncbi:AroM family protein [Phreatobacter stygius]|uniref:AroM family protein n=1 Tax=Phreatobacter stygius TaxID=1940610 RepID=A0A4D7AW74_9HYPH|nr:AroM family protein [Phreatobacter stygius]QCI65914.1 AroM family protein [Phreatobacter stygius]
MTIRKLGTLTIGQAPRADITPILDAHVDNALPRIHAGVLDGLTAGEVAEQFAPRPGKPVLITRLRDGSSVIIDKQATETAARDKLAALEAEGCTTVVMLCTGTFETLHCARARLVEPDRILPPTVAAAVQDAQVGIIVPLIEQIDSEASKWAALARQPIYAAASPYAEGQAELEAAARDLAARGADILLMDCMGFLEQHRQVVAQASGLPVILSNALIAKVVSEIV